MDSFFPLKVGYVNDCSFGVMGRVFLIENDGPVYTCATCNVQIAKSEDLVDAWLDLYQFYLVYNVMIAEVPVLYHDDLFSGHEVSCVNCCALLGWRNPAPPPDQSPGDEIMPAFVFEHGRVAPPPPDNLPQD
ncbi:hypothetical protein DY000_02035063 [Brassica cretica]|uniref:Yippee domain-containing protein n=1 Tax=Brassica cretica TaxID=69181 RepID=A0ABQ7DKZ3_BRACR|nr:hypothetical protein DY000_02035063 [Brassica cretica]